MKLINEDFGNDFVRNVVIFYVKKSLSIHTDNHTDDPLMIFVI